jgi:hypothetical protein
MALYQLSGALAERMDQASPADRAHYGMIIQEIDRFRDRPMEPSELPGYPSAPPGSPIGDSAMEWTSLTCSFGGLAGWW